MTSDDEVEYRLALPFDSDEPEFARGVEVGCVFTELRHTPSDRAASFTVHATNAEMVLRFSETLGRYVSSEEIGDDWLRVRFAPIGHRPAPIPDNPEFDVDMCICGEEWPHEEQADV